MTDCLFCKIIAGNIPTEKVYEDAECFAFLDINPVNIGHTLLVPKAHHANLYETPDEILAHLAPIIKKLAIVVKKAVLADGINIEMNNDSAASQLIFHTHIHIIPRFLNDEAHYWKHKGKYHDGEMASIGKKMQENFKIFENPPLDRFDTWNMAKKKLHEETDVPDRFPKEGEVWMSVLGKNIGYEQNGGGDNFSRPLLIIKKFNNHMFWAIPLSTTQKSLDFYYNFIDPNQNSVSAIIAQLKLVSLKRLKRKLYDMPQEKLEDIKRKTTELF
ncbi:MAG: HIT domain-containing protein [Patescibacteria group bacterium]